MQWFDYRPSPGQLNNPYVKAAASKKAGRSQSLLTDKRDVDVNQLTLSKLAAIEDGSAVLPQRDADQVAAGSSRRPRGDKNTANYNRAKAPMHVRFRGKKGSKSYGGSGKHRNMSNHKKPYQVMRKLI